MLQIPSGHASHVRNVSELDGRAFCQGDLAMTCMVEKKNNTRYRIPDKSRALGVEGYFNLCQLLLRSRAGSNTVQLN